MKKTVIAVFLLSLVSMVTVSCGGKQASADSSAIHMAWLYDMQTVDVAQTTEHYMVPMNVFDRLFEMEKDDNGEMYAVPSLCDVYSVSEDCLTYSFKLKDGIRFSNGDILSSDDVRYTFERLLEIDECNSEIPYEVAGSEDFAAGTAGSLSGFEIIDDLSFSITLSEPNAGFISELTSPAMSIVNRKVSQEHPDWGHNIEYLTGTGPYCLTEWKAQDHFTFEYNPNYWGKEPDVKKFVLDIIPDGSTQDLMFRSGRLDILCVPNISSETFKKIYKEEYADQLVESGQAAIYYMAMNENNEFLSDVNVRKAIQKSIDIDSIIGNILDGQAAPQHGIIPKGIWGYNDALKTTVYDPDEAKKMLADAGYAPGEIRFNLAWSEEDLSDDEKLVHEVIRQNLKDVGIEVNLEPYDPAAWLDKRNAGELDSFISAWFMDYNDPANIMYTFFGSPELTAGRSLHYKDEEVMSRVARASSIIDDGERMAEYRALETKIVKDDAAWVALYEPESTYAVSKRIRHLEPHWAGYIGTFYIKDISLQ